MSDHNYVPDNIDGPQHDAAGNAAASPEVNQNGSVQYGVGPFSIREVAIGGAWLLALIVSFFSIVQGVFVSVWQSDLNWIFAIGLPTAAVFLLALRRLSPSTIRRVGSLGIDQFASVAFSVSAVYWVGIVWSTISSSVVTGFWATTWVPWVEAILALGLVVATVFARFIPVFKEDFDHRPVVDAHPAARSARPVTARPRPEPQPVAAPQHGAPQYGAPQYGAPVNGVAAYGAPAGAPYAAPTAAPQQAADSSFATPQDAPVDAQQYAAPTSDAFSGQFPDQSTAEQQHDATPEVSTATASTQAIADGDAHAFLNSWDAPHVDDYVEETVIVSQESRDQVADVEAAAPTPVVQQPFWALVPVERDIHDENTGAPLFRIGPTAWALVLEDRGHSFLVRHDDGRTGILHDVSGVTRG